MDRTLRHLANEAVAGDITSRFRTPDSRSAAAALTQRLRANRAQTCRCIGDEHCEDCEVHSAPEPRRATG